MGMETAAAIGIGALGGMAMSSMQKTPNIPSPPAVEAPPVQQAAKTPDVQTVANQMSGTGQAGGSPGAAQTFLSGSGGVDPSKLTLNKKTLLG